MAGRKNRRIGAFSRRLSLQLQATKDPQWHRVFTETLQRLHLTKPQRPMQHVDTEDDPWLAELDRAFGDLEGRIATADVWMILTLGLYGRTLDDRLRLTAVMRLLGGEAGCCASAPGSGLVRCSRCSPSLLAAG